MGTVTANASGFGKSNKKVVSTKGGLVMPDGYKRADEDILRAPTTTTNSKQEPGAAPAGFPDGWSNIADASIFTLGKTIKPVITASGIQLMLYNYKQRVYCSDAMSTAYQYPLTDAKVSDGEGGAIQVEVPLDGTIYDLRSGAVLTWCPKDGSLVRNLLGTLKSADKPTPLRVYPVHVDKDRRIWVKLV